MALVVLAALAIAATSLQPGSPNLDTLSKQGQARAGLVALERSGIGGGALEPIEILTAAGHSQAVAARLRGVPGVAGAFAAGGPQWQRAGTALVDVIPHADGSSAAGRGTTAAVRNAAHATGPEVRVGGIGAENADFVSAIYGSFPVMIALIAVLTFLLLARAFRSLLLPLKAVVLNIISVAAAWGVITLVWQEGHGSSLLWGIAATHSVTAWIPLMIFAFLFGLSMDYEVFILARMREEFDGTGSTDTAVVRGIGRTGRLVTSAALILFLAFVSMASGPETDIKVFATGLAAGILLDATIIRALAGARGGVAVRALELVAAGASSQVAAGRAIAARSAIARGGRRVAARWTDSLRSCAQAHYSGVVYAPLIPPSTRNEVALT